MTKIFDAALLDRSFEVVSDNDPGAGLIRAFNNKRWKYAVFGSRPKAGDYGLLLTRERFIDDLIIRARIDRHLGARWRQQLIDSPDYLSCFVAGAMSPGPEKYHLDMSAVLTKLNPGQQRRVHDELSNYLQGFELARDASVEYLDVHSIDGNMRDAPFIALDHEKVVGVYHPGSTQNWSRALRRGAGAGAGASASAAPPQAGPQSSPQPAAAKSAMENPAKEEGSGTGQPFEAFPRLDAPDEIARVGLFDFTIGYSDKPDPKADSQKGFKVPPPVDNETMLVIATAEGATVIEPSNVRLPLDMTAGHTFSARVDPRAGRVRVCAKYFYRGRPVGHIVKSVPLQGLPHSRGPAHPGDENVIAEFNPQLANYADIAPVDIVLMVQKGGHEEVTWKALVTSTEEVFGPFTTSLPDTRQFARDLARLRQLHGDKGDAARSELEFQGQTIAGHIPGAILNEVLAPAFRDGTPNILLMTDEPFIPWELSMLGPPHVPKPAFLGELARIGRWWSGESLGGPRAESDIAYISAVAASEYREDSGQRQLEHARKEREWIEREQLCGPVHVVEAVKPDVDAWLAVVPRPSRHLAHIALHGYSDTQAEDQGLILGDGQALTPGRLIGRFFPGDVPRFSMVFLNACQVGTAGERLGRIGGFPGAVLRGGATAFIGPLWEVDDEVAREVAENFYTLVFKQGVDVCEALRRVRALPGLKDSITPWAYLYYGHPTLKLTRAN